MTDTTTTGTTGTTTNDAGEPITAESTAATNTADGNTEQQVADTKGEQPAVPETYEFQMPEGVQLDQDTATEFSATAKELGLTQEQAQKVADIAVKQAQRQAETHAALVESWVESVKTDKEIGGDKLEANLGIARKAMDTFGSPELKDVLNASGLGNHPAVIRAFLKAGKAISDDGFVTGAPKGAETNLANRMFPNMN